MRHMTFTNQHFDVLVVDGGSSLALQNCTVGYVSLNSSGTAIGLVAERSVIRSVVSHSQLLGNVTLVECNVGDNGTSIPLSFLTGTGPHSTVSVVRTNVTANYKAVIVSDAHGLVRFINSSIVTESVNPAYGFMVDGNVFGPVQLVHCTVFASSASSTVGATAVYLKTVRAGTNVLIKDCTMEALSRSSSAGTAVGLFLGDVTSSACVYVTGGSILARGVAPTYSHALALRPERLGGALVVEEVRITSNGSARSYGFYVDRLGSNSALLFRGAEIIALYPGRDVRAFSVEQLWTNAVAVLESTTLRAPRGTCLVFSTTAPFPHGLVDMRGLYLAECLYTFLDRSSTSSTTYHQNCLELPGHVFSDVPIGYQPSTVVYPCVDHTPRTTPVRADMSAALSLETCAAFGPVAPFTTAGSDVHILPTGSYANQTFNGIVFVIGASSVTIENCTIDTLVIKNRTAGSSLLVLKSTIGSVMAATEFRGNATFVGCGIGSSEEAKAIEFPLGTASESSFAIVCSNVTAAQQGIFCEDSYGRFDIVDSRIESHGSTPTQGLAFPSYVYGVITMTRVVVHASSTSIVGTTAVYFQHVRSGIQLVNCTLTGYAATGEESNSCGLQIGVLHSNGCVFTAGGSIFVSCSSDTACKAYAALFRSITGGAVTFENGATMTSVGALSQAFTATYLEADSIILLRDVEVIALVPAQNAKQFPAHAYFVWVTSGSPVSILDNVTLRAIAGACLSFSGSTGIAPGLVDLRGLHLTECHYNILLPAKPPAKFDQNCLTVNGTATEEPVGPPHLTTVYPCVNNTPRTTRVDASVATAGSCTAFGSIAPFRIFRTNTLHGDVNRSSEYLGRLIIEDPGVVVLTDIEARSITFRRSSSTSLDNVVSNTRITLNRCTIGREGLHFAAPVAHLELVMDGSTITAKRGTTSTVPLFSLVSMRHSSVVVRRSTFTGYRMLYAASSVVNSTIRFQGTKLVSPTRCVDCGSVTYFDFVGQVSLSDLSFDGCSILSSKPLETHQKASDFVFAFASLDRTQLLINDTTSTFWNASSSIFLDVREHNQSCVTIARTSVLMTCADNSSNPSSRNYQCPRTNTRAYFLHGWSSMTEHANANSSYITLDDVNVTMNTYAATAVYLPSLQNVDIVMSNVRAILTTREINSYFFHADDANNTVVALIGSTVSVAQAYAYRFGTVLDRVSLLNARNTFNARHVMYGYLPQSTVNARRCDNAVSTARSNPLSDVFKGLGAMIRKCIKSVDPSTCAETPAVYHALGINRERVVIPHTHHETPSAPTATNVWIIIGVVGGWVVVGCIGLAVYFVFRMCRRDADEEDDDEASAESRNNVQFAYRYNEEVRAWNDEGDTPGDPEVNMHPDQLASNNARIREWLEDVDACPMEIDLSRPVDDIEILYRDGADASIAAGINDDDDDDEEEDWEEDVREQSRSQAMSVDRPFPAWTTRVSRFGLSSLCRSDAEGQWSTPTASSQSVGPREKPTADHRARKQEDDVL